MGRARAARPLGALPLPIRIAGNPWRLDADPRSIESAALSLLDFAASAERIAQEIDESAKRPYRGGWSGETAQTYDQHRRGQTRDLRAAGELAKEMGGDLESAAAALRHADAQLREALARLSARMPVTVGEEAVVIQPRTPSDVPAARAAAQIPAQIRAELDGQLFAAAAAMDRIRPRWQALADALEQVASGGHEPFTLPPEADRTYVIRDGDRVIVNTGPGDDEVKISVDPASGVQLVQINGYQYAYPPDAELTVRGGQGDDRIEVEPGTTVRVTLLGGSGYDHLRGGRGDDRLLGNSAGDKLYGGGGADRVSGGAGRDYIDGGAGADLLGGGAGSDTVYGLEGDDRIDGGEGDDYLEGGTGNDRIDGGWGSDVLSGGQGGDVLRGGSGDDTTYAGAGADTVDGGRGVDTAFTDPADQAGHAAGGVCGGPADEAGRERVVGAERVVTVELTDVGGDVRVEGSPEFVERVRADLEMLRSSPRGQAMLAELAANHEASRSALAGLPVVGGLVNQGDTLTITEYPGDDQSTADADLSRRPGRQSAVAYSPALDRLYDGPPVVILFHELAHVYDYQNETVADGVYTGQQNPDAPNKERVAVGLPIDHDRDPSTPERLDPRHPFELTENGLREEMGVRDRPAY